MIDYSVGVTLHCDPKLLCLFFNIYKHVWFIVLMEQKEKRATSICLIVKFLASKSLDNQSSNVHAQVISVVKVPRGTEIIRHRNVSNVGSLDWLLFLYNQMFCSVKTSQLLGLFCIE